AEEGDALEEINSSTSWKASLLTIEAGARGLVGSRTFRSFTKLGFPASKARSLCRCLSTVAARCSYAIYLAHKDVVWHHKSDLICLDDMPQTPTNLNSGPLRDVNSAARLIDAPQAELKLYYVEPAEVAPVP